ncbi:MAG TPA: hypothetical protein PK863_01960 [Candidatus Dojkabacteria bacterium]|nr:hypothetical protein [Candidatus Dojkabacteria bacterium]HRP50775.1 hypothetical protein [Candidatus Dojkabacteria bacterium]
MLFTEFTTLLRFRTGTNSTTLTDAEILPLMNFHKDLLAQKVVAEVSESYFGAIATTNLIEDQREYSLVIDASTGDEVISLEKVEAKLDGTNWIELEEVQLSSIDRAITEDMIISLFGNERGRAKYYQFRGAIYLLTGAITNVTSGLKVYFATYPDPWEAGDLDDAVDLSIAPSSTTRGFPKELHAPLLYLCSKDVKSNKDKPLPLDEYEQSIEKFIDDALFQMRRKNKDRSYEITTPLSRGEAYPNHGFEL